MEDVLVSIEKIIMQKLHSLGYEECKKNLKTASHIEQAGFDYPSLLSYVHWYMSLSESAANYLDLVLYKCLNISTFSGNEYNILKHYKRYENFNDNWFPLFEINCELTSLSAELNSSAAIVCLDCTNEREPNLVFFHNESPYIGEKIVSLEAFLRMLHELILDAVRFKPGEFNEQVNFKVHVKHSLVKQLLEKYSVPPFWFDGVLDVPYSTIESCRKFSVNSQEADDYQDCILSTVYGSF